MLQIPGMRLDSDNPVGSQLLTLVSQRWQLDYCLLYLAFPRESFQTISSWTIHPQKICILGQVVPGQFAPKDHCPLGQFVPKDVLGNCH
jgi:hypothetical protein